MTNTTEQKENKPVRSLSNILGDMKEGKNFEKIFNEEMKKFKEEQDKQA